FRREPRVVGWITHVARGNGNRSAIASPRPRNRFDLRANVVIGKRTVGLEAGLLHQRDRARVAVAFFVEIADENLAVEQRAGDEIGHTVVGMLAGVDLVGIGALLAIGELAQRDRDLYKLL